MPDDQAMGLRRLFGSARHDTVAVCGSGSARIAVHLAAALGDAGRRVLILDRSIGEVATAVGEKARYDLVHVLDGDRRLDEVIVETRKGVAVLPAARGLDRLAVESADWREALRAAVPGLATRFDVWLVNGLLPGAAPDVPVLLALSPTARAITTVYAHIKALARAQGRHDFAVVVHHASSLAAAQKVFACVAETAARFLAAHLELIGFVPKERISAHGKANDAAVNPFVLLAEALLGHTPAPVDARATLPTWAIPTRMTGMTSWATS